MIIVFHTQIQFTDNMHFSNDIMHQAIQWYRISYSNFLHQKLYLLRVIRNWNSDIKNWISDIKNPSFDIINRISDSAK